MKILFFSTLKKKSQFFPHIFFDVDFLFFLELIFFLTYHIDQKFHVLSISGTFRAIRVRYNALKLGQLEIPAKSKDF